MESLRTNTEGKPKSANLAPSHAVFVQRSDEMDTLWQMWTTTVRNKVPTVTLLVGEPGTGKSSILEAFYRQLASSKVWDPDDYWPHDVIARRLEFLCDISKTEWPTERKNRRALFLWLAASSKNVISSCETDKDSSTAEFDTSPWLRMIQGIKNHHLPEFRDGTLYDRVKGPGRALILDLIGETVGAVIPGFGPAKTITTGGLSIYKEIKKPWIKKHIPDQKVLLEGLENSIVEFMAELADEHRPLVLSFDDLQWCDESSLNILLALLNEITKKPVMILAALRDVDSKAENRPTNSFMRQLERMSCDGLNYKVLKVGSMSEEATREQLKMLFGPLSNPELIQWIAGKTEGVPLFTDHLARYLFEDNKVDSTGRFTESVTVDTLERDWNQKKIPCDAGGLKKIPYDAGCVVSQRLERLKEKDAIQYRLLQIGSMEGRTFRDRYLASVASEYFDLNNMNVPSVRMSLDEVERTHSLISLQESSLLPDGNVEFSYRYSHHFIMEYLSVNLPEPLRETCLGCLAKMFQNDAQSIKSHKFPESVIEKTERLQKEHIVWKQLQNIRSLTAEEYHQAYIATSDLSHILIRMGLIRQALRMRKNSVELAEKGNALWPSDTDLLNDLYVADSKLGSLYQHHLWDLEKAEQVYQRCLNRFEQLSKDGSNKKATLYLAKVYGDMGDIASSQEDLNQAQGYYEQSQALFESLALQKESGKTLGALVGCSDRLGMLALKQWDLERAQNQFDHGLKVTHQQCNYLKSSDCDHSKATRFLRFGQTSVALGDFDQARLWFQRALELRLTIVQKRNLLYDRRALFHVYLWKLGTLEFDSGNLEKAEEYFNLSLPIAKQFVTVNKYPQGQRDYAWCHLKLGAIARERGEFDHCQQFFEKALQHMSQGVQDEAHSIAQWNLSMTYNEIGFNLMQINDFDMAEACLEKALSIRQSMAEVGKNPETLMRLGNAYMRLGDLELKRQNLIESDKWYHQDQQLRQELFELHAAPQLRLDLANSLRRLGHVSMEGLDLRNAHSLFAKALETMEPLVIESKYANLHKDYFHLLIDVGKLSIQLQAPSAALAHFENANIAYKKMRDFNLHKSVKETLPSLQKHLAKLKQL